MTTVPLKYNDIVVGTAEIEEDETGIKIISSNITDIKLAKILEGDFSENSISSNDLITYKVPSIFNASAACQRIIDRAKKQQTNIEAMLTPEALARINNLES